jgi:YVTN family beta-propeller protein
MRVWALGATLLLAVMVASCGSNSTTAGVTVTPGAIQVLLGDSQPFAAVVTGISTTTVSWQICLPANTNQTNVAPTVCTNPQGPVSGCTLPTVKTLLVGFGTITLNGLYTAPLQMPPTKTFDIVATSCTNTSGGFGIAQVTLDSGIRVTVFPAVASLPAGGPLPFQFTAIVTPPGNPAVNWTLSSPPLPPPPATNLGSISPTGLYTAPTTVTASTVTITATSSVDPSAFGTATVTLQAAADPTITSISPTTAAEGSVQQDVYVAGTSFFSGSTVIMGGVTEPLSAITMISSTLLRVTIPGSQLTVPVPLQIAVNNGIGTSTPPPPPTISTLTVNPVRPALIGSSLDSVPQNPLASAGITLTGGFFVPSGTTATFNGAGCGMAVCTSFLDSRDLFMTIPAGQLSVPGLYPIVVQNSDAAAKMKPSEAALNLAVTPAAIPGASSGSVTVGSNPSAIAIDYADDEAVVANTGDGTVSIINLATNTVVNTISVGNKPTGVAVDDLLPDPVALVVNSADQSVTAIDLTTKKQTTICVSVVSGVLNPPFPCPMATNPPLPYSVGINPITPQPTPQVFNGTFAPVTHRAIVAYQSTNVATVLDVSESSGGIPALALVHQVGAGVTNFSTGQNPAVAIDPRLNWALITPGGAGTINVVDLGLDAYAPGGDSGRAPQVVANLNIATSVQGVAIDSETHQAFLTDPNAGTVADTNGSFSTFSMLDQHVNTVQFQNSGVLEATTGFVAAAVDPLTNVGVAVNSKSSTAVVANLETGIVLQTVALTNPAQAVAVDPVSNQAVVVYSGAGSVSFIPLGSNTPPVVNPLQIVEANPAIAYAPTATSITSSAVAAVDLPLTITGGGFMSGSQVLLDGTPLPGTPVVSPNGRRITTIVPAPMLKSARNYFVQVQNPGGGVSNVTDLTVIQPVLVELSPVGVAVDTARDLAVVTNSGPNNPGNVAGTGTVSLVALTTTTPMGPSQVQAGRVGTIPFCVTVSDCVPAIPVGTIPIGVAVLPRLGLALVGNSGSGNLSLVDVTETNLPLQAASGCNGSGCAGQLGVTIDQDNGLAAIANSTSNNVTFAQISTGPLAVSPTGTISVDLFPTAVAIDPVVNTQSPGIGEAAVTTASQSSTIEFLSVPSAATIGQRVTGVQLPTDIIFDPLNQVFMAVDSLENEFDIIDPITFQQTPVLVGINPTSLDYNFQASTLVTVNTASHTMSVVEYVCPPPPNGLPATCPAAQVRAVLGIGGTQSLAFPPIAPQTVAMDPDLNLIVLVDPDNNRILLVPALH